VALDQIEAPLVGSVLLEGVGVAWVAICEAAIEAGQLWLVVYHWMLSQRCNEHVGVDQSRLLRGEKSAVGSAGPEL